MLITSACGAAESSQTAQSSTTNPNPLANLRLSEAERSGGDATTTDIGSLAFGRPLPNLSDRERSQFAIGNTFFNDLWLPAPSADSPDRDGLGPTFNAESCASCHLHDGRARPPVDEADPNPGLIIRLSGTSWLGSQLQDRSLEAVAAEGKVVIETTEIKGRFDDGTEFTLLKPTYKVILADGSELPAGVVASARVAPPTFGLGLLEAVPEDAIRSNAKTNPLARDQISGRAVTVLAADGQKRLGRFGWKATQPTVESQTIEAFRQDIGVTSVQQPDTNCSDLQPDCQRALTGGRPELSSLRRDRIVFYTRTLSVPRRRNPTKPVNRQGANLFRSSGCASCHTETLKTADADLPDLRSQTIHPYTDLLTHDMGPALADSGSDPDAAEWRTAPLWGIGLTEDVSAHTRFLHDGRARSISEAILWHGGEGEPSKLKYKSLTAQDRNALLAFLNSI